MINEIMSFLLCNYIVYITLQILKELIIERERGRCGRDRMVVGFTTTYAISAYHHWCCEFESRSGRGVQHYVIKFVSDLTGRWFSPGPPVSSTNKTDRQTPSNKQTSNIIERAYLSKTKLEAPRSLYSSPGNNNNISQQNLITSVKKFNKCSLCHCRPLLQTNLGRGSPFNVSYQNCCKKTFMSMILKI